MSKARPKVYENLFYRDFMFNFRNYWAIRYQICTALVSELCYTAAFYYRKVVTMIADITFTYSKIDLYTGGIG